MPHRSYQLEVCCVTSEHAICAEKRGADRIELCTRLETGGMTPETDVVAFITSQLTIPIRVMIRSTEVGFEADELLLEKMIQSIQALRKYPIQGFVMGVMNHNQVDRETIPLLLRCAYPFPVTFHKAIDSSDDILDDLRWLNQFPQIDTILTSGGAEHALEGYPQILQMKGVFQRDIMAGGKIKPGQVEELHQKLYLPWYHGRSIV